MHTQNSMILSDSVNFLRIRPRYGVLLTVNVLQACKQRVFPASVLDLSLVPTAEKSCYYFERVFLTQVKACHENSIPFIGTLLFKVNKVKHCC